MKTDKIFYQILQEFPQFFFNLISADLTHISNYEFIALELKETSFRLDGLFVTKENHEQYPLYFVEPQFYEEDNFYDRVFPSIFLYFHQYHPLNEDWFAVIIFDTRNNDVVIPPRYRELVQHRLIRIYLDEISEDMRNSLSFGIFQLIIESPKKAGELARNLIDLAKNQPLDVISSQQIVELIETIVLYKFPKLTRQEIETMLKLDDIKQTKVYQEAFAEGRQEAFAEGELAQKIATISLLYELGLNAQQIAEKLGLNLAVVQQKIQSMNRN